MSRFFIIVVVIIIIIIIINSWRICHVEYLIGVLVVASGLIVEEQYLAFYCDISLLRRHNAVATVIFIYLLLKYFGQVP